MRSQFALSLLDAMQFFAATWAPVLEVLMAWMPSEGWRGWVNFLRRAVCNIVCVAWAAGLDQVVLHSQGVQSTELAVLLLNICTAALTRSALEQSHVEQAALAQPCS